MKIKRETVSEKWCRNNECEWRVIFNIDEPEGGQNHIELPSSKRDLLTIIKNRFLSCWIEGIFFVRIFTGWILDF